MALGSWVKTWTKLPEPSKLYIEYLRAKDAHKPIEP